MNMQLYHDYRFFRGCFESNTSGKVYKITIPKHDRFYEYMKPYFTSEKVTGQTKVMIDDLIVEDPDRLFFDERTFTLNTLLLATDKKDIAHSFNVTIKGLQLNKTQTSRIAYADGRWMLSLYELQIPYCASIDIVENTDN